MTTVLAALAIIVVIFGAALTWSEWVARGDLRALRRRHKVVARSARATSRRRPVEPPALGGSRPAAPTKSARVDVPPRGGWS